MGKIIFDTASSFNGWIADENNSLSWLFAVPDDGSAAADLPDAAVLVEGSTTYEWLLAETEMLTRPEKWHEYYADRPTFVFTSRDLPVPAGADVRFVSGPVPDLLPVLRHAAGDGDIWIVGGGDLAGQFLDAGALDEIAITLAPVALTGGAPLLPRAIGSDRLRLTQARAIGQFVRVRYEVVPAAGG